MSQIAEQTKVFAGITRRNLNDMFDVASGELSEIIESRSVATEKHFIVSIYYTGTVYGEYLLALDEDTAAQLLGLEIPASKEAREEVREEICDALAELLNIVVGESIVSLQTTYAKLTITAPRIYFGEIRYPNFKTGRTTLSTPFGPIECHFCLDLMRLDLATSYSEAVDSLIDVNTKLKEANKHLAEQQAQLVHNEKMASVGVLASGVAHEINNPLFFVDANLGSLEEYINVIESMLRLYEKLSDSLQGVDGLWNEELRAIHSESEENDIAFVMEDTKQLLVETQDGISRIKSIVQMLRDFSQADKSGMVSTDLNEVAENSVALFTPTNGEELDICTNLGDGLPRVVCNAAEIGQVFSVVLRNAVQSFQDSSSGRRQIAISSEADDNSVVVTVEDTGLGIPAEYLDRIFEPFFTTRGEGNGTGLGLSVAYGIVKRHRGSISVSSVPGKGTKVAIRLPFAHEKSAV